MTDQSIGFLWVAFQIEDLCYQKCDADIRKALRTLPQDLTETYNRVLMRIVKDRNEEVVSKIFRWVAAARRPLLLDELQEAITIEPRDSYLHKDRLVNNPNNLISWCSSLIILQDEDSVVQFAHHSVNQFLLSDRYDTVTKSFHFQLPEVDHEVGELCVTYLHFNDFERQVSRLPKQSLHFQPKDIAAHTVISNRNRAARYGANFMRMFSNTARPITFDITKQLNESLCKNNSVQLQSGYPFLAHVKQFWLLHTTDFSPQNTSTWDLWADLINKEHHLAVKPWTGKTDEDVEEIIMSYILAETHLALLSFFCDRENKYAFSDPSLCLLLIKASGAGNASFVERLITAEVDVKFDTGASAHTALVAAAEGGHIEVVELLLTTRFSLGGYHFLDEQSALNIAVRRGHLELVRRLTLLETDFDWPRDSIQSALHLAVVGGDVMMVELLLTVKAGLNLYVDYHDLLRAAAKNGHEEITKLLLMVGADVNAENFILKNTSLYAASEFGHRGVVNVALAANADVNAVDRTFRRTALHAAAANGHTEIVMTLLTMKADVHAPEGIFGQTALHLAIEGNNIETVKVLLKANAEVNATDSSGRTPFLLAAQRGHVEAMRILWPTNADINVVNHITGQTALHVAAANGHAEVVKILLAARANVHAPDGISGGPALCLAAKHGHTAVVKILLAADADVNTVEETRRTPLILAAHYSPTEVMKILLAVGADADARDGNSRRSALHMAAERGHREVVKVLLAAKPQLEIFDAYGLRPADRARENGHWDVFRLLNKAEASTVR